MATRPTIVFDLDGTLVDTAADLLTALNILIAREGMEPVTSEGIKGLVGSGARVMLQSAFAVAGRPLAPARLEELFATYLGIYDAHIADESRPYPGAVEALDCFAADNWRLAVCTNKTEGLARKLLTLLGLAERFVAITGQDTFGFRKPDPRHLTETIRLAGGSDDNAVMVGDSRTDVDTARAARIPVVAVDYGYSTVPVDQLGATRVISRLADLYGAVSGIREKIAS